MAPLGSASAATSATVSVTTSVAVSATASASSLVEGTITVGNRQYVRTGWNALSEDIQIVIGFFMGAALFLILYFALMKLLFIWDGFCEKRKKRGQQKDTSSSDVELQSREQEQM